MMKFKNYELVRLETGVEYDRENAPRYDIKKSIVILKSGTDKKSQQKYNLYIGKINFLALYPNTKNPAKIRVNNLGGNAFHFFLANQLLELQV